MAVNFRYQDLAYTIVSRFEEAFRDFISTRLTYLYDDFKLGIPNGIISKAQNRTSEFDINSSCSEFLQETDFTDLKEIAIYNKSYNNFFSDTSLTQESFSDIYDSIYGLRCKIAHNKPFSAINLESLIELIEKIIPEIKPYGDNLKKYIEDVKNSPENIIVASVPINFGSCEADEIPNNLPTPDYEYEGGFVGRKKDIEQVKKLLLGDMHRVISITGAGGVGKTSLAVKVLNDISIKNKNTFDYIIWLSAKDKKLSYLGIEEIDPTIKDYEELLDKIFEVTGLDESITSANLEEKEANIKLILDMCKKILIVIDNLETVTDERIKNFIIDCHPKVKILTTSRKGLGQVNRIYELKELTEDESISLFRIICRDKNINDLAKLPNKIIKNYVKKVSYYPLAIKWLIGQVSRGKRINDIINSISDDTSDITKFCFEQIYNNLNINSQNVLCTLSCLDESPSYGILSYISGLNTSEFEDAIDELITVSLVISEQHIDEQENLINRYTLLPLTRGFVNNQLDKNPQLKRAIQERYGKFKQINEEAIKARNQFNYDLANMGAVTDEEKVATILLRSAKQKYNEGLYEEAKLDYKRAQKIAPEFPAVYRNWSAMESRELHHVEAESLISKAARLNPSDSNTWLVWGKINMHNGNLEEALKKFNKAYSINNNDISIINALGNAKCRLGLHEEADKLFNKALGISVNLKSKKQEIINRTSLASNLRRWSEVYTSDKNYNMAEEKLIGALEHINKAMEIDKTDPHTAILKSKINLEMAYLYKKTNSMQALCYFKDAIIKNPIKQKAIDFTVKAINEITNILRLEDKLDVINEYVPIELFEFIKKDMRWAEKITSIQSKIKQKPKHGKIIRYDIKRMFCIISDNDAYNDTYLGHFSDFTSLDASKIYKLNGKLVSFVPVVKDKQKNAKMITIIN